MFKKLTAACQGFAETSNTLTDNTAKLTHQYDDLKKKIGEQLIPVANGMMIAFSAGLNGLVTVFKFVKTIIEEVGIIIKKAFEANRPRKGKKISRDTWENSLFE